jgi:ketosteroid isomerase-like protein
MSSEDNIKTITTAYEAFSRGDIARILDLVSDDVDWAAETTSDAAPWYGVRHGKDELAAFFTDFGSAVDVEDFTPVTIAANDTDVLTVIRMRGTLRANGKQAAMNLHHQFSLRDGKIVYFRGSEDTAQIVDLLRS